MNVDLEDYNYIIMIENLLLIGGGVFMLKCKNCWFNLEEGDIFCPNCGFKQQEDDFKDFSSNEVALKVNNQLDFQEIINVIIKCF